MMKSELKKLSSVEAYVLTAYGQILIETILLANVSDRTAVVTIYMEKNDGPSEAVFHGNVYRGFTTSAYFSKDVQFFLEAGDKIRALARNLDGSNPDGNVIDVVVSYVNLPSSSSSSGSIGGSIGGSSSSSSVTLTVPGEPTIVLAQQGYPIAWEAPTSDGGSPITGYRLYADGVLAEETTMGDAALSSVDSLLAGTVAEVSAVNAIGEGPKSTPVVVADDDSDSTPNPNPTNAYVDALNSQTLARLSGKDPSTDMFVYTNQDPYAPNFTRNPNCWINGVSNISCFSPAHLSGTSWFQRAGTLVTKKHIVYAKHYTINILPGGTPILFVDDDNNVVQRNLIDYRVDPVKDIAVGLLDSEVSSNIKVAPLLPTNYGDFFPSYPKSSDLFYVGLDQEEKAILKFGYIYGNASFLANNVTGSYSQFSEDIVGGDSGNPVFIIVDNQLVLIGCWLYSTSGPFVTSRYSEINAMIEEMSPGEGYSLTSVVLSGSSSSGSIGGSS